MDEGQSINFTARGSKNDTLNVKWAIVSEALAYKMQHSIGATAKDFGFKRIVYQDAFDTTYTYDLN